MASRVGCFWRHAPGVRAATRGAGGELVGTPAHARRPLTYHLWRRPRCDTMSGENRKPGAVGVAEVGSSGPLRLLQGPTLPEAASPEAAAMRVLLVEDHKPLARALRQGLEEENFAVDLA